MNLFIKNMVCLRCKMAVEAVLNTLDIAFISVGIGWAELQEPAGTDQLAEINAALLHYGLEIMINRKSIIVERIKNTIGEMLHTTDTHDTVKFTAHLSKVLSYDYTYLSNVFAEAGEGTIEKYFIHHRVERAKELLIYEEMTLKEAAYFLNYSSVGHFCRQFKKVTGETPSEFKKLNRSPGFIWKKN